MRLPRLLPFAMFLAACGQTGPLMLPEQTMTPPASDPVVVTPPEDEADDDRPGASDAPNDAPDTLPDTP